MKSANTTTSSGNTFSISGRRTGDNLVLLNGIEYTGTSQLAVTPCGVSGDLLGIDAIHHDHCYDGETNSIRSENCVLTSLSEGARAGQMVATHGSLLLTI